MQTSLLAESFLVGFNPWYPQLPPTGPDSFPLLQLVRIDANRPVKEVYEALSDRLLEIEDWEHGREVRAGVHARPEAGSPHLGDQPVLPVTR